MLQHRELQHLCVGLVVLHVTLCKVCGRLSDVAGNVLKKSTKLQASQRRRHLKLVYRKTLRIFVFCRSSFFPEHWFPVLSGISAHHSSAFPKDQTMPFSIQCMCSCEFHSVGQVPGKASSEASLTIRGSRSSETHKIPFSKAYILPLCQREGRLPQCFGNFYLTYIY